MFSLYLEFAGHLQLLGGYPYGIVKQNHDDNSEEHCKVTNHGPHLGMGNDNTQQSVVSNMACQGYQCLVIPSLVCRQGLITLVGKYRLVLNCLRKADMKKVEKNKMVDQKRTSGV